MRFILILITAFNLYIINKPTMSISIYGQELLIVIGIGMLFNFIMGLLMNVLRIENSIMWFLFNGFTIWEEDRVETGVDYIKVNLFGLIIWLAFCVAAYFGLANII